MSTSVKWSFESPIGCSSCITTSGVSSRKIFYSVIYGHEILLANADHIINAECDQKQQFRESKMAMSATVILKIETITTLGIRRLANEYRLLGVHETNASCGPIWQNSQYLT